MFSHQPTWDDCQQLLQVLFTTEERERILLEAWKNVPGINGQPTQLQNASKSQQAAVAMAFTGQSASDIRRRLQCLEGLQTLSLQDLVKEAEKV